MVNRVQTHLAIGLVALASCATSDSPKLVASGARPAALPAAFDFSQQPLDGSTPVASIAEVQLPQDAVSGLFDPAEHWEVCALKLSPGLAGTFRFEFVDARKSEENQLFSPFDVSAGESGLGVIIGIRGPRSDGSSEGGAVTIFAVTRDATSVAWSSPLPLGSCPTPDLTRLLDRDASIAWRTDLKTSMSSTCIVCWSWNGTLSAMFARGRNPLLEDAKFRGYIGPAIKALERDVRQWSGPVLGLRMSFVSS